MAETPAGERICVAAHPRARRQIVEWRSRAALLAFLLAAGLSLRAGTPLAVACGRALVAGVVTYLAVWAAAVQIWRALIVAEIRRAASESAQPPREADVVTR